MRTKLPLVSLWLFVATQCVVPMIAGEWQHISSVQHKGDLRTLFFTSDRIGFLVECDPTQSSWSSNFLLKTTDGGTTWDVSTSSELCSPAVFFVDSTTGYAATLGSAVGAQGVRRTTDGGEQWSMADTTVGTASSFAATALYFTSSSVGFASAEGAIAKTTNGGKSWVHSSYTPTSHIASMVFTSPTTGYAVGYDAPQILQTTDAGATWHSRTDRYALLSVVFPSATRGYAVGWDGTIVYTTDAGTTWHTPTSTDGNQHTLRCVSCFREHTCVAVGDSGTVLFTTDGGTTWTRQDVPTTRDLYSVACLDNNTCFAAGDGGTLLRATGVVATDVPPLPETVPSAQVFVHPATAVTTIRVPTPLDDAVLRVWNIAGQEMLSRDHLYGTAIDINTQHVPAGLYFFSIQQRDGNIAFGKWLMP